MFHFSPIFSHHFYKKEKLLGVTFDGDYGKYSPTIFIRLFSVISSSMLDNKHPLYVLGNLIDWSLFENTFSPLFSSTNGRPPKSIRLMMGLLILKYLHNQGKNIAFPTDSKLLNKIIGQCHKIAAKEKTKVRQSYNREIKELKRTQRFRGRSRNHKKVAGADRRMRTIAGGAGSRRCLFFTDHLC